MILIIYTKRAYFRKIYNKNYTRCEFKRNILTKKSANCTTASNSCKMKKKNNKLWSWISNKGSTKKRISLILKTNSPNMYLFNPESPIPEKQARTDPVGSPPGLHLQKPTQAAPERPPIQDAVRETQGRPGNVPSAKEEQRINWSVSLGLNLIKIRYGQKIKRRRKTFPRSHTFLLEAKTYVFSESEALGSAGYDEQQFVKQ